MDTHHAYLYIADDITQLALPQEYAVPGSDVTHVCIDSFGIEDARDIATQAFRKPVTLPKRVFVIVVRELTSQAQNTLLKLFEEPPQDTVFYLAVPKEGSVLPTLRSRMCMTDPVATHAADDADFKLFREASYAQRFEQIAQLAKQKDTQTMEHILRGVEAYAHEDPQQHATLLRNLLLVRSYFGMPGASKKMLLENIALYL